MKTCFFCSAPITRHNRSRKPVFPRWLLSNLEAQDERFIGKHWSYPNEPTIIFSEREQDFRSLVLGNVCKACNTGWMAQLEEDTRPLLEALLTGRPTVLTREQCNILASWTFKTAAVLNYSVNYKKIVPLEHIRNFFITSRLPDNATVDFAWGSKVGIHWYLGGNKKFVTDRSRRLTESQKRASYVITLQFNHVLLRLAWVPVDGVKAVTIPTNAVYRIFPQVNSEIKVIRGPIFKDDAQFHFMATILAEKDVYPSNLDLPPLEDEPTLLLNEKGTKANTIQKITALCQAGKQGGLLFYSHSGHGTIQADSGSLSCCSDTLMSNPGYIVWNGNTGTNYQWDGIHDCIVTYDLHLLSVQKIRKHFLRNGTEPVIVFTCQVGQPTVEVNLADEGWRGLGSYSFIKVMTEDPAITFRNLITRMNDLFAEMGFDQVSEVICKEDLLDHPFRNKPPYPKPLLAMVLDICRKHSDPGHFIIDHDEFSP